MQDLKDNGFQESIAQQILDKLGTPKKFHLIKVARLFGHCFRANVWVYKDLPDQFCSSYKIAYSYFITTNETFEITNCKPELPSNVRKEPNRITAATPVAIGVN